MTDMNELLAKTANKTPKKSATKVPEVNLDPKLADEVCELLTAKKDAEAKFRAAEGRLLVEVQVEYETRAKKGDFSKSFNVPGIKTKGVQVSFKDQFKAKPLEEAKELQKALGEDFDRFYEVKRELKLEDTSDETITLLMETLGEDKFRAIFGIKMTVVAKSDMDRKQFNLPDDARPEQYAPNVKTR